MASPPVCHDDMLKPSVQTAGIAAAVDWTKRNSDASAKPVVLVGWDGPSDPENPQNWSRKRKWTVTACGIAFCFCVSVSVSAYSIAASAIQTRFNCSQEVALLPVTTFTIAFAVTPLVLAPLSEIYGRSRIYLTAATLHSLLYIPEALVPNLAALLVLRFLSGCAGSCALSVVGGTIVDLFLEQERGKPMALFSVVAFGAPSIGPVIFSYAAQDLGLPIINWILFALSSVITIMLFLFLRETRASVILSRKAIRLASTQPGSLIRPVKMLLTEPVLIAFTAWISFTWGVLYLSLVSLPLVYEQLYNFDVGRVGIVYSSQVVGVFLGFVVDRFCARLYRSHVQQRGPEARLYTGLGAAVFITLGGFLWAFTTYRTVHWFIPCIGMAILYIGMFCCFVTTHAYLADAYGAYAASALAAMLFCRNLVGAVFPLFTRALYDKLGIQGASGLTAGIGTLLSAMPIFLFLRGSQLRARSPFSQQLRGPVDPAEEDEEKSSETTAVDIEAAGSPVDLCPPATLTT